MYPESGYMEGPAEPKQVKVSRDLAEALIAYRDWYFETYPDDERDRNLVPSRFRVPPLVQQYFREALIARNGGEDPRVKTQKEINALWRSGSTQGSG
jgi:hypothetical protein